MVSEFSKHVLRQSGNAKKLMIELYGVNLNQSTAEKGLAAIRRHIRHDLKLEEARDGEGAKYQDLNETTINADGSITTIRYQKLQEADLADDYQIMILNGFDPVQFELVTCKKRGGHWNVYSVEDGVNTLHTFRIELTVRPIQKLVSTDQIRSVFEDLQIPELRTYSYDILDACFTETIYAHPTFWAASWK